MEDGQCEILKRYFGHDSLRSGQGEVIERVLAGINTLAVLPTGGGKSLCYQFPAVVQPGLTLVVSPLIALMQDQVDALLQLGISAARWDSTLKAEDLERLVESLRRGTISLLYLSPERLDSAELWDVLRQVDVGLVAVDEAHCVSEWGHSFRPAYLTLAKKIRRIKPRSILALTATASPAVASEIRKSFGILKRDQVQTSFYRKNLHYKITACKDEEKDEALLSALADKSRWPAIVYGTRRETVETLASLLRDHGMTARAYHAGMPADARSDVQQQFVRGEFSVICATIAFGMGVDMAGVRSVIHYQPPKSPEGWLQESGRAGRDGQVSHCEMIISGNDRTMLESFIIAQKPTHQSVVNALGKVFSQGKRAVVSRYDLCSLNDMSWESVDILLARLEILGWVSPEQGSWLWCYAVPLVSIDKVLFGFEPAQQKVLRPILESRQRVSLMEISGGSVLGQLKLMGLLHELNETGDVRMKFSHSLHHLRVRREPENMVALADEMFEVFDHHVVSGQNRIDAVMLVATSRRCISRALLSYFGEKLDSDCGTCSSCLGERRLRKLPRSQVDSMTERELEIVQSIVNERKPALATPERLARFLCGIYSPGMMRNRLYQRKTRGMLKRLPYEDVLACTMVQNI